MMNRLLTFGASLFKATLAPTVGSRNTRREICRTFKVAEPPLHRVGAGDASRYRRSGTEVVASRAHC